MYLCLITADVSTNAEWILDKPTQQNVCNRVDCCQFASRSISFWSCDNISGTSEYENFT